MFIPLVTSLNTNGDTPVTNILSMVLDSVPFLTAAKKLRKKPA